MNRAPRRLLFACTRNAVRSPMAAALAGRRLGPGAVIGSAGVEPGLVNPFAVAVMDEIGLDIRGHRARMFDELPGCSFELVVALSASAFRAAQSFAAGAPAAVEYWAVPDPTLHDGSREQRLAAFRSVRRDLEARIGARFPDAPGPG